MKVHSLTVGINKFIEPGNDLAGCVNDSWDITRVLNPEPIYGDAIDRVPFFHNASSQKHLHNEKATKKSVIEAVGVLLSKLGDGDFGFLWFSTHGTYGKDTSGDEVDGTDEKLVFYDFGLWNDDNVMKTMKARNPKSLLFIGTDACHSGTVTRLYIPQDRNIRHKVRFLPPEHFPSEFGLKPARSVKKPTRITNLPNVIHFAGCQDTEYCYDANFKGRANGAFTYYLIKALTQLKAGATFADWFEKVRVYLPSVEYSQTPRCNASKKLMSLQIPVTKG